MTTITIRKERIEEVKVKGMPLGRHIRHDSRSWDFRVAEPTAGVVSKEWPRYIPILNQGNLGSCTGNGSVGQIGTGPAYAPTLKAKPAFKFDEPAAVSIYSLATSLDSYDGTYLPTDTGSDGLSAAKAAQQMGLISGYRHAMSTDDMIAGLQISAGMVGVNWMVGMDNVNTKTGEIKPTGQVRGGHEFEVYKVDLERGQFWFYQSWGPWGYLEDGKSSGKMFMTIENFATLLKADGDATFFTPLDQPAPTPQPDPTGNVVKTFTQAQATDIQNWADKPHVWSLATKAAKAWNI